MGHCILLRKGETHTEPVNYKANFADNIWEQIIDAFQKNDLPTTTLADYCYEFMFRKCTALIQASALPATSLKQYCYYNMFQNCTSLTQAPALPATTLAPSCYRSMFENCTSLKLSSTKTDEYTVAYRVPSSGTGRKAAYALYLMFKSIGGTFTDDPSINKTYYLSNTNTIV